MTVYAQITDGTIATVRSLPNTAVADDGAVVTGLQYADAEMLAALGWVAVVESTPPTPQPGEVLSETVQLVDGVPTRVYELVAVAADPIVERIAELEAKSTAVEAVLVTKALVTEKELADAKAEVTGIVAEVIAEP